ncbi:DNA methyltransferase [Rubrobacter marinus]|uniref:DNA methyltransferase n=1 Tax=Rubrobacter marinus TaxID=2653852 RepID=A0A6G8PUN4_9ACTN|nr:DNA methyltransferase [Rubrobacter marinus]QIN77515.1 DNA methyltransferase [Rubrobacter marinus]
MEDLAVLASREGRRPRPIYGAHRWFARRFGSAFRALLTAAALPDGGDFWKSYYEGTDHWHGKTVLDPFVGGGTSVVEASRLGADVVGVDVDAVACAITRFETHAAEAPDLSPALTQLTEAVGEGLAPYYRTETAEGEDRIVLHYFWVQTVTCGNCAETVEAHPHHQLAYEAEGTRQWAFCPQCHGVQELPRGETELRCDGCVVTVPIQTGPVRYGRLTCPCCGSRERLIDVAARTGRPPEWRLFALETLETAPTGKRSVPLSQRRFRPATDADLRVFESAERALRERAEPDGSLPWIPERRIPREGRADDRLLNYGYDKYSELFNARQLLHLSLLAEAVAGLGEPEREAVTLAFSDHLTTNCMMSHYAFGWRRLAPLFSVRAYRHVTRPVEINPWLDGTGRGTFPNAVHGVQRAIEFARQPKEPLVKGGFRPVSDSAAGASAEILHSNSRDLRGRLKDESVDLVLTDPPYLDNVAYSELSDFFLPWLQLLGLAAADGEEVAGFEENLAARGRDEAAIEEYASSLARSFREVARVLKADGRLVFTYQHGVAGAWHALASAMNEAGLRPIQVFPLLGDGNAGSHNHEGTSKWDAVFVAVEDGSATTTGPLKLSEAQSEHVRAHYGRWAKRLSKMTEGRFREADRRNFFRACLVAGALGMFSCSEVEGRTPLAAALKQTPPGPTEQKEAPDASIV